MWPGTPCQAHLQPALTVSTLSQILYQSTLSPLQPPSSPSPQASCIQACCIPPSSSSTPALLIHPSCIPPSCLQPCPTQPCPYSTLPYSALLQLEAAEDVPCCQVQGVRGLIIQLVGEQPGAVRVHRQLQLTERLRRQPPTGELRINNTRR